MRLIGKYRLVVKGDPRQVPSTTSAIGYLFERLLTGQPADMSNLDNFGIEVRQLEDSHEIITVPPPDQP